MTNSASDTTTATDRFKTQLAQSAEMIEDALRAYLPEHPAQGEDEAPATIVAAMRHGALNGGKRIRPFLMIETARMLGHDAPGVLNAACALECVHCYSLIHDDLPAMDDDALRRGKPTVHVAYGEAMAILAGDGLLTLAFEILAKDDVHRDPAVRAELVLGLAKNAGIGGMVGGQVLDIEAEHRTRTEEEILRLQAMKTGALLRYACEAGAMLASAGSKERAIVTRFGTIIGLAFQLADDLLDVTATSEQLGKTAGKDLTSEKATLVSLYGVDETRKKLKGLINEAETLLSPFGKKAEVLISTARFIADRTH
ncbi:farnesyl diphosphate synthase [Cohaesibacter sp. ES.047]|uniref:polyprenyl synthetase family protein n=1 Tax=Cohaesibacter sp. ES.047 TaxID=1798205 RepID=UPI000BC01927|nr:farnesyl diphosphate synthase [Cohaesibacter sp. ES.047]SNY90777.1 farnesyl diphosphate synthase [Cohaesibacter sp. ES.047]